ncbi:MAG: MBL fold metallo-hydrolase [Acidobacteria bacterium]|nr:MBL fold metallo-hydrolase [Acidobacteriota bacterium]
MRRSIYLGTLTLFGIVMMATGFEARQERSSLVVHNLSDNLYMLANATGVEGIGSGGNTAIFVTGGGVTLVDTKIQGYGQDILAAVRTLTDKPVTTIINTHTHWDHSGSNTEFPDTVQFVAHENTRRNMASEDCDDGAGFQGGSIKNCQAFKGANARYLPETTYSDTLTLFSGADQIDLYYFGRGHTDGDTFVVFREARTMHTGDMFARPGLPFLDVPNSNGSAVEFGETLKKAIAGISGVDTVIPGHNPVPLAWSDFVNYSGFYNDLVMQTQAGKAAGRTVDEVVSSYRVPSQFSGNAAPPDRVRATVQYLFDGQ